MEPLDGFVPTPVVVDTKIVPGCVGWTRISLIARPVNAVVPAIPVVTSGLMGPVRFAVVLALSMR